MDSQTVVFLARLSYTALPRVNLSSLLASWVASTPPITVASTQLQVDTMCPVVIDSLQLEGCGIAEPPPDVTVKAVAAGVSVAVLVVLISAVAMVIALSIYYKRQSKSRYVYSLVPLHYSTHTFDSCWITTHIYVCTWCALGGILLMQCCAHYTLCRPNCPLPNPVDEYECMGSGSGGAVLGNMTQNPSYISTIEAVPSVTFGTAAGLDNKEEGHYEVLPAEASQEVPEEANDHNDDDDEDEEYVIN